MDEHGGQVQQLSLPQAAARGDEVAVRDLLARGVSVHQRNTYNRTAIQTMNFSNADIARMLLENGANPNETDDFLRAPIHDAAQSGYVETLKVLVEKGADLTLQDKLGNTPAHVAAMKGNTQALLFLSRGSYLFTRNSNSQTVVDIASARPALVDCVRAILEETQTLQHLCRLAIRKACGNRIDEVSSDLPDRLRDYVKLR